MLINDCTPAKPCSSKTLTKEKKYFFQSNDQYFLELYIDEKKKIFLYYAMMQLNQKIKDMKLN